MRLPLSCDRAEALLSEDREGRLPDPIREELRGHLEACLACRRLRDAVEDVVAALRSEPVPEPGPELALRAAAAALAVSRGSRGLVSPRRWTRTAWLRAAAASVVIGSGIALAATGDPGRALARLYGRTVAFGARVVERGERLVDDLRVLKVRLAASFAGSLDRMNDRIEGYRRDRDREDRRGPEWFSNPASSTGVRASADGGTGEAARVVLAAWAF